MNAPVRHVRFKQADIKRVAKGLADAGISDYRIEIDPNGKIAIMMGPSAKKAGDSSWDDL